MVAATIPSTTSMCPYTGMIHVPAQLLSALLRQLAAATTENEKTRAWLTNRDVEPSDKVLGYNYLLASGASPGVPNADRTSEYKRATQKTIATWSGMSESQANRRTGGLLATGLFQRKQTKLWVEEDPEHPKAPPHWETITRLAPPDGKAWSDTWADPRRITITRAPALDSDKGRAADKRAKIRCPACGCDDPECLERRCRNCGAITPLVEVDTPEKDDQGTPTPPRARRAAAMGGTVADSATAIPRIQADSRRHATTAHRTGADQAVADSATVPPPMILPYPPSSTAESATREEKPFIDVDIPISIGADSATADGALAAATQVILNAVGQAPNHVVMLPRRTDTGNKYISREGALTRAQIEAHLKGTATYGSNFFWPDALVAEERRTLALAWDSDEKDGGLAPLILAADRLEDAGLRPLLVSNPTKDSGHLWLYFRESVEVARALKAAEHIAPTLATRPERFPDPTKSNGGRLRLPGGVYLPIGQPPALVRVAVGVAEQGPIWHDGTSPEGWATIAAAVSDGAILEATYLPFDKRPQAPRRAAVPRRDAPKVERTGSGDFFARFNADNPVESMVQVDQRGSRTYFKAPWRDERTASVILNNDGSWHDFGSGRHGKDVFDLYCAMNEYWNEATNKPDRKTAYRALGGDRTAPPPATAIQAPPMTHAPMGTMPELEYEPAPPSTELTFGQPTKRCPTCHGTEYRMRARWGDEVCATCWPPPLHIQGRTPTHDGGAS